MGHKGFDNYNLCAIIEACANGGVSELKFGNVEVKFYPKFTQTLDPTLSPTENSAMPEPFQFMPSAMQDSRQLPTQSNNAFDKDLLEDLRVSQLMIDDPHGFEREIVNSHLRGDVSNETIQN